MFYYYAGVSLHVVVYLTTGVVALSSRFYEAFCTIDMYRCLVVARILSKKLGTMGVHSKRNPPKMPSGPTARLQLC